MLVPVLTILLVRLGLNSMVNGQFDSDYDSLQNSKRLYDFGIGKRGYVLGGNKRLPSYNFGLGKRDVNSLNDETKNLMAHAYTRQDLDRLIPSVHDGNENYLNGWQFAANKAKDIWHSKRGPKLYSFGLGKRSDGDYYYFDSDGGEFEKRAPGEHHNRFGFGIGKRSVAGDSVFENKNINRNVFEKLSRPHAD